MCHRGIGGQGGSHIVATVGFVAPQTGCLSASSETGGQSIGHGPPKPMAATYDGKHGVYYQLTCAAAGGKTRSSQAKETAAIHSKPRHQQHRSHATCGIYRIPSPVVLPLSTWLLPVPIQRTRPAPTPIDSKPSAHQRRTWRGMTDCCTGGVDSTFGLHLTRHNQEPISAAVCMWPRTTAASGLHHPRPPTVSDQHRPAIRIPYPSRDPIQNKPASPFRVSKHGQLSLPTLHHVSHF